MPHKRVTITLPPELLDAVEEAAAGEHRTRSEFIRVALMRYLRRPTLPEALMDQIEDYLELHDPEAIRDIAIASEEARAGEARDAYAFLSVVRGAISNQKT